MIDQQLKTNVQNYWGTEPVGGWTTNAKKGTEEYFREIDQYRYGYYAWWLPVVMGFMSSGGKQVLEIGVGTGADIAQFAIHNAIVTGIDITQEHLRLTSERFKYYGLNGTFQYDDAESLSFKDDSFDIVYSYGVIHHTPNIEAAVKEIYRVLKPGGEARIMVYAKYSEFNLFIHLKGLVMGYFWRHGYQETISALCEGCSFDKPIPCGRYSKGQIMKLFREARFKDIKVSKHLLTSGNIPIIGRLLTKRQLEWLALYIGWNLVIKAVKPTH